MKHPWKWLAVAGVLMSAGWALAQGAGHTVQKSPAAAVDAVPGPVLQVIAPQVEPRAMCAVEICVPGDQACLQASFERVMSCLRSGSVGAMLPDCTGCALPGGRGKLFRAHGAGITLYGAIGTPVSQKRLLQSIANRVEMPLVIRGE